MAFKNGWLSNFQGLRTLTLDQVIVHTVLHQSSTSTYMPNFTEIEETFCGRTYVRMHGQTDGGTFETGFIRSTLSKSRSINHHNCTAYPFHPQRSPDTNLTCRL